LLPGPGIADVPRLNQSTRPTRFSSIGCTYCAIPSSSSWTWTSCRGAGKKRRGHDERNLAHHGSSPKRPSSFVECARLAQVLVMPVQARSGSRPSPYLSEVLCTCLLLQRGSLSRKKVSTAIKENELPDSSNRSGGGGAPPPPPPPPPPPAAGARARAENLGAWGRMGPQGSAWGRTGPHRRHRAAPAPGRMEPHHGASSWHGARPKNNPVTTTRITRKRKKEKARGRLLPG
jgi:hypothetical protein